jgi:hypothetical protein
VSCRLGTAALTLAVTVGASAAWWWAPWLVAGTPLAKLGTVVGFGGVLAFLAVAQPATALVLRRLESGQPGSGET